MTISVVIADDRAPTRVLVTEALESQGFTVLADVGSGRPATSRRRAC